MKLIDAHCHLDPFFYNDVEQVIERCRKNNVKAIAGGIDPFTNRHVLELKQKYPDVIFPSLGLYPRDALRKEAEQANAVLELEYDFEKELGFIRSNKDKIIAVGEIGMDFKNGADVKEQEHRFRKLIELAIEMEKPVVIHSRKAEEEVIRILEEFKYKKVVMHCFCGKQPFAKRVRENGWYFSIPTSIVRDEHFQKIVKETPIRLLLTETDSPFLSPFKDVRNEPSFVIETVKKIAQLKNITEEDVATLVMRNADYLFGALK